MIKHLKWPIFSVFLLLASSIQAQIYEYGFGVGIITYGGDLSQGTFDNPNLGIQGIYRINFDKDVSFRLSLLYGKVAGADDGKDLFSAIRTASFERTILEGTAAFEYHFLDYKDGRSTIRWSPYAFAGLGFTKILNLDSETDNFSSLQTILPFGIGFKYLIGKQFSAGLEFGLRKTFFDELDGISDGDLIDKNFQYGNPNDKDWYHFFGISFSYILYKIECKYQYVPNKTLYK